MIWLLWIYSFKIVGAEFYECIILFYSYIRKGIINMLASTAILVFTRHNQHACFKGYFGLYNAWFKGYFGFYKYMVSCLFFVNLFCLFIFSANVSSSYLFIFSANVSSSDKMKMHVFLLMLQFTIYTWKFTLFSLPSQAFSR